MPEIPADPGAALLLKLSETVARSTAELGRAARPASAAGNRSSWAHANLGKLVAAGLAIRVNGNPTRWLRTAKGTAAALGHA